MLFRDENHHLDEVLGHWKEDFEEKEQEREGRIRNVGIELKFPVVDKEGRAVSPGVMTDLWEFLGEEGWDVITDPHYKHLIGASFPGEPADDFAGTETGYCKMEFSLGYKGNLWQLDERIHALAELLEKFRQRKEENVYFLCYGIHPVTPPSDDLMTKKQRNLFWHKAFDNRRVNLLSITCSNQVHADVAVEETAAALNVFNGLSPVEIALNANSNIWNGRVNPECKALSLNFWNRWLPNSPRVGMTPRRFGSLTDYTVFISGFKPVYVKRKGQYYGIGHYASFAEYWAAGEKAIGVDEYGVRIPLVPQKEDFDLHYTFCWNDARLSGYYTLENRVNCQQPPHRLMVPAAFTLGIMEKLLPVQSLVDSFAWGELEAAREDAVNKGMQANLNGEKIKELCQEVLCLAQKGLEQRKLGEEKFLVPLWESFETTTCPADHAREIFARNGLRDFLEAHSTTRILNKLPAGV